MLQALFLLLYISPGIVFAQGYGYYPGARAPATIPLDEYHGPPPSMMNSYAPKGPLPLANNFGPFAPRQHFVPQPKPFWRPPPPPRPPPPNFNYQPYSPPPPPPPRQDYDVPPPAPSPPPPPPTRPPPPPTTTQSYDEPAPPPSRPYVPPLTWRTPAPQPPPPSSYEPYESEENEYNYGPAQTTTRAAYRPSPSPPPPSTRKPTTTTQAPSSYEPYESEENAYNYPETTTTRPAYRPSPSPPPSTTRKPTTTQAQSYEHYEPYEPYESEEYETTTRKPTTKYRPPPTTTRSPPPTTRARTTTTQPPPPPPETYEPYEPYESEEYEPTTKPAYRPPPSTPAYESEENEYNYGPVETTTEQPTTNNYDFAYMNTHEQTTPPTTTTRMTKTTTTTTRPTTTRAPYRAPSTTRAPYRAPSTTQRRTYPTTRRTNPPTTARRTTHRPPSTPPTPRTRGPEWVTPPMSPKIAYFPHSAEEGESPCDAAADEGDGCWDFFQYVPGVKMGSKTPQKYEGVESEERSEENPYQPEQTQKGYRAGKEKYSEEVPETYMVPPKEPDSSEFTQPPPLPVNEKEKPKEEIKATEYKRATDKPDVESTTYKFPTGNEVFVGELEEPVVIRDKVIEVNLPKNENPEKDIDSDEEIASTRKPMKPSKGSQLKWIPGDKEHEQEEKKIVNESGEKNGKVMEMSTEKTPNTSEKQKEMVEVSTEKKEEKKEEQKEEEEEKREIPKPKELKEEETPTKVLTKVLTPKSSEREESEENEKPQSTEKTLKSREWKNEEITAKPIIVTSTTTSTTITTESITITTENVPEIIKTQSTSPPSFTTKSPIDSPPITTNQSFQSVTHDPRFLNNTRALIEERVIDINHLLDLPPRPSTTTTSTTVTTPPSTTMINESDPEPLNRQEFSKSNSKSNQSKPIKPKLNQSKEELNREIPKEFPSLNLFRQLSYNGNITIWREFVDGKTLNNTTVADKDEITVEKPPDRNVFLLPFRERQNEMPNRFKIPKMNAKNEEEQKRELWPDFEKTTVPNEIRSPQKIPLSTVSQGETSIVRSSTVANGNQSQEDQTAISINQQLAGSSTTIQTPHQVTTVIPTKSKSQIQSNLIQSNLIQSNPIHSNPIHSNPIHSNPIQSNPIQSTNPKDPQFFTSTTVLPFDEIFEGTTPGNSGRKRKILDSKRLSNQKIWNWTNLEPEPKIFEQKLIDNDEKKKHKENDNQTSNERRISANSTANFPKEIPTSPSEKWETEKRKENENLVTKEATTMRTNEVNGSDLCSPNDLKCLLESIPSGKISQQVVVNERNEGTTRTPNTTIHTTTTTITTPTSATPTTTTLSPTSSLLPSFPSTTNPPTTFLHSSTVATPLSSTVETSEFSRLLTEFPIHSLTNDDKQQQQQHFVPHIDFRQIWHDRTESTTVKLQFPESSTIQSTILSDERVQNLVERGVPNHVSDRLNRVDVWKSMKIKEEFGKDPIEVNEISIALMNTQKSVSPTTDPRALTDLLPNFTWFSTRSPPLPPLDASTESPNEMNELNELNELNQLNQLNQLNERNELIDRVTPPIISLSTPTPDSSLPEIVENHLVNEHSLDPDYEEFPKPQVPSISFPLEELPLTLEEKEMNDDQPNETTEGPKERSIEALFKPDIFVKKDVQGSKINFYNEVDELPPISHHRGISVQYLDRNFHEADRPDDANFPEPSQILQPASPKPLLTKVFLPGPGPVKGSRKCCSCCGRAGTPPRAPESHRFDELKNKILVTPSNASPNEARLIQQEAQPTPPPQYPQPSQFPLFSPQQPQYQPVYPQSSGCPCQSPPQSPCCQPAQPCCLPQLSLPLPRPCCIPQAQLCCQPPPPPPIACCLPPPPCCSQPVIPPCQRACPSCPCRRRMALAIRRLKRQSLFGSCQQCSLSGEPYRASEIQGGCTNCAARLTGFRSKRSPADDVLKFLGFQVSAPSCAACSGSAMRMARRRKRQTGCESGCTRRKRETETLQREKRSNPIGCSPCNNLGQLFARSKRETENRVKRSSSPFGCPCNARVSTNYGQSLFGRYKRQVETVAECDATCCDFSSCPNEASFERSRHRYFRSIL